MATLLVFHLLYYLSTQKKPLPLFNNWSGFLYNYFELIIIFINEIIIFGNYNYDFDHKLKTVNYRFNLSQLF